MIYIGGVLAEVNTDHFILVGHGVFFTVWLTEQHQQQKIASKFTKLEGQELAIAVWFEANFSKCWLANTKPRKLGKIIDL